MSALVFTSRTAEALPKRVRPTFLVPRIAHPKLTSANHDRLVRSSGKRSNSGSLAASSPPQRIGVRTEVVEVPAHVEDEEVFLVLTWTEQVRA